MTQTESYELFRDNTECGVPIIVPVTRTSERINTITSTPTIARGFDTSRFYLKCGDNAEQESQQLRFLRSIGSPTPTVVAIRREGERTMFVTNHAGAPFHEWFQANDSQKRNEILFSFGEELARLQQQLRIAPFSPELMAYSFLTSAHIVDSFFYKRAASQVAVGEYVLHKRVLNSSGRSDLQAIPEAFAVLQEQLRNKFIQNKNKLPWYLQELANTVDTLADEFLGKLAPYARYVVSSRSDNGEARGPFLSIVDPDVIFGDFKPENLLVHAVENKKPTITFIDPIIVGGSNYFDLAKFVSRYLLDEPDATNRKYLHQLFKGYGVKPSATLPVYGPFTFVDLVLIDRLNILRSYLKRYIDGNREYRLVKKLDQREFIESILEQMTNLAHLGIPTALDSFFEGNIQYAK